MKVPSAKRPGATRKQERLFFVGLLLLIVAGGILGMYSWWLIHIDPHVNWWLVGSGVASLVAAFPFMMMRGKR